MEYKEARREFKNLNKLKIKEYFQTQTTKDFKNSKKFWQFYKSSVKLRSDKSDDCPEIIQNGDVKASTAGEQAEMFNSFFTNIEALASYYLVLNISKSKHKITETKNKIA